MFRLPQKVHNDERYLFLRELLEPLSSASITQTDRQQTDRVHTVDRVENYRQLWTIAVVQFRRTLTENYDGNDDRPFCFQVRFTKYTHISGEVCRGRSEKISTSNQNIGYCSE